MFTPTRIPPPTSARVLSCCLPAVAVVFLAACDPVGGTCGSDADCPAGICVNGSCQEAPPGAGLGLCATDDDCDRGQLCGSEQTCIAQDSGVLCVSSAECDDSQYCRTADMTCALLLPGACKRADQCPATAPRCSAPPNGVGRCLECLTSVDCPLPGATCAVNGLCQGGLETGGGAETSSSASGPEPASSSGEPPPSSTTGSSGPTPNDDVDLGGWTLRDTDTGHTGVIPPGTRVPRGGILVLSRGVAQEAFQQTWGVTLGPRVAYLDAQAGNTGVPVVNGGEAWTLSDAGGTVRDGVTLAGTTGKSYQRRHAGAASSVTHWEVVVDSDATPGRTLLGAEDRGVFISEWSDASGTGRYPYEFIEIYVNP